MADLTSTELDRHLDPIAVLQELDRAPNLGVEVGITYRYFKPYLLEIHRPLMAPRFLLTPGLLVLEMAVVKQTGTGRVRHGGDLYEIGASLLFKSESLRRGQHAHLFE